MEEAARVYAEALFDVSKKSGQLDAVRDELAQFSDALHENRDLQVFFFSPYFSSAEKQAGLGRVISGADEHFTNFLNLLIDKHRMPIVFRARKEFDELWKHENKKLDVTVTSAVALEQSVVDKIGEEIQKQTGQSVELSSQVDAEILGGIVLQVGNMVLDASIRQRLEKLRKNVAQAA